MASYKEMDAFLANVQLRAYRHAALSTPSSDIALCITRHAMLELSTRHAHAASRDLPVLFQRLLQSAIRRQVRKQYWHACLPTLFHALIPPKLEDTTPTLLESLPIRADVEGESVEDWCERQDVALVIDASLRFLPLFQRAAFLLHYWERMSLADTARVLSCSPRRARVASAHACRTLSVILLQKGVSI